MKDKKMKIIIAVILLLLTVSFADDCGVGTEGGNVFIEYVKDITMTKEHIYINMYKDSAIVKCKFWFYNNGTEKSRSVGFPDFWASPPQASTPIDDFKTWVNGKEIEVSKKIQSTIEVHKNDTFPDDYKEWFVWSTNFQAKDTTIIENHYTARYSGCNYTREASIYYVIGTGRTWEGRIGSALITFDFSNLISTAWIKQPSSPDSSIKTKIDDNKVTFTFQNYEPKDKDGFLLEFYPPWDTACCGQLDSLFMELIMKKTKNELRIMRNEIYARHGYVFKDEKLKNYFSAKKWYKPKKHFNLNTLSVAEQKTAKEIKKIEDSK